MAKPVNAPITNAPTKPGGEKTGRATVEYEKAFWNVMRGRHFAVENALREGSDPDGGFLVPDEFERRLVEALEEENIIRKLSHTITTSYGDRKIPVVAAKGTASWVEEGGQIPESDDKFGQISLGAYKLATMIKVSEELMPDSVFDLQAYIAKEFARRNGDKEEEAFITGDGSGKPTGFLSDSGGGQMGVTTAGATAITLGEMLDLYYALKSPYRKKAVFIMNDSTVKAIRKLKDANGQFLWQPSIRLFKRLNELFAQTGQVGFLATQRVDGRLILPESVKILQQNA